MRQKIVVISVPVLVASLIWMQMIDGERLMGFVRYFLYRGKGAVQQVGSAPPQKNVGHAQLCRQNLLRIQNAKRKAGFDRGNTVGHVSWAEVLQAMYPEEARRGRVTPARMAGLMPVCPSGGSYLLGSLHEVARCSIMGNETLPVDDDHIVSN